jgi:hypothetical protein
MSIRQNQNAHGWISGQFAVALAEQAAMNDVAEVAEELLKEPLVKSYATTVTKLLKDTKELVHNNKAVADEDLYVPTAAATRQQQQQQRSDATDVEDSSERSAFPLVGETQQPGGRRAYIHADNNPGNIKRGDGDDEGLASSDLELVSGICFVLPKSETGTVIAQIDTPSALLVAANEQGQRKRTMRAQEAAGSSDGSANAEALLFEETALPRSEEQDNNGDGAARIKRLLEEQKQMHKRLNESSVEYQALLQGLERWQVARQHSFDVVTSTPVPHTATV